MADRSTPALPKAPPALTHGCVRCGRPVALDVAMCEICNPLGLSQPASTQVHGTVFLAVTIAFIFLAVAGRVALSGIGPFPATVAQVTKAGDGLTISVSVTNQGSKTGSTTCRVTRPEGTGPFVIVQSPHVDPGQTTTFRTTTDRFGTQPLRLAVSCDAP